MAERDWETMTGSASGTPYRMETERMHFEETTYGFEWGGIVVERAVSHKGHVVLTVRSRDPRNHNEMDIYASPTGKSIRAVKVKRSRSIHGGSQ